MRIENQLLVGGEISAGLGNQLFQYAAILALSQRLDAKLYCDTFMPAKDLTRPLGLKEFGLKWHEQRTPRARGSLRAFGRAIGLRGNNPFAHATYFEESEGRFNPEFLTLAAPCFLKGYFQSWRYFADYDAEVRAAFDVGKLEAGASVAMEKRIRAATNPVAVHVRRGDFSDTPQHAAERGPLAAEYYRKARAAIEIDVERPTFFLFSDEPEKAMAELSGWHDLIPVTGMTPHEDFRLMATCRHFIIANSTFSWWAAWLGKAPDKIVVAPSTWVGPVNQRESSWPTSYRRRGE